MLDNLGASLISSNDFTNINYFMASSNSNFEPPPVQSNVVAHKTDDSFDRLFDTSQPAFDAASMMNSMCLNQTQNTVSMDRTVIVEPPSQVFSILDEDHSSDTLTKTNGHTLEEMPEEEWLDQQQPANTTFENVNTALNRTLVVVDNVKQPPVSLNVTGNADKVAPCTWAPKMNDTFHLDQVEMANDTFELTTPVLDEEERDLNRTVNLTCNGFKPDGRLEYSEYRFCLWELHGLS